MLKIRRTFMSDTGTNAGSGEPANADGEKTVENKGQENNVDNNDDNLRDIWQNPSEDIDAGKTPNQSTQTPQQTPDADKTFSTYIDKLGLTKDINLSEISQELNQGNTESLGNAFKSVADKVYRQTMIDVSRLVDQKISKGIEAAVQQSAHATEGNLVVRQMHDALTFTKDPSIAPVAKAALAQLMKKGKSSEEAIDGVRTFFQRMSKLSAKELGLNAPPRNRPGGQPFNPANAIQDDDDEETDWLETLGVG